MKRLCLLTILCLPLLTGFAQVPADVPTKEDTQLLLIDGERLLKAGHDLKADWDTQRVALAERFEKQVEAIDATMKQLEYSMDYGDKELRLRIQERLADMRRMHDDLAQLLDEIKAAGAVKWMNIQGDIEDKLEDAQD